jgi:DNA (cytosine-5)-methyltransferase 1
MAGVPAERGLRGPELHRGRPADAGREPDERPGASDLRLVGSLFSGIGGLDLGLHRAGWNHAFFCESDAYRRDVLRARFPGVPIYEDVREVAEGARPGGLRTMGGGRGGEHALAEGRDGGIDAGDGVHAEPAGGDQGSRRPGWELERGGVAPDDLPRVGLLAGGFPCQDVSVAGQRRGLAGGRSGLFYEFARIIEALRPRSVLMENVPGLLTSHGGRDFGVVVGTLAELGYGVGWRIVDSRYFGVPQRRRRVFIVGVLAERDPRAAAERAGEILAVGTRCQRHLAAGVKAGPKPTSAPPSSPGDDRPHYYVEDFEDGTLTSSTGRIDRHPLIVGAVTAKWAKQSGGPAGDEAQNLIAAPLSHGSNPNSNMAGRRREDDENLVQTFNVMPETGQGADLMAIPTDRAMALSGLNGQAHDRVTLAASATGVRRFTPTECERLQALPDGWSDIGGTPDTRRYAALGDAVTASVAEWIGRRLLA